jgi:hypothetical protein
MNVPVFLHGFAKEVCMVIWIALLTALFGLGANTHGGMPTWTTPSHSVVTPMDGTSGGPSFH